jgi:DNA-binding MarR family transcriptional regulator
MNDIKQHEYNLLNEIAQDPLVTQASLSDRLDIAIGSVNWYIKRLIHRGWVKVSHLDRTRLKYDLTPEGMRVFTQRAYLYARDSLKVYSEYRHKAKEFVNALKHDGIEAVYLDGSDEIMDILRLTCLESGLRLLDQPDTVVLGANGHGYCVIRNEQTPNPA